MKRQKHKNRNKQYKNNKNKKDKKLTRKEKETESKKVKFKQSAVAKIPKNIILLWIGIISILTIIAYYPSFDNELTNWDDDEYVTKNIYLKDLSFDNIKEIFKESSFMGNYHPLSLLSLSIDYSIGGEDENGKIDPFMYHFTNILLHLFITLLVLWFVYELFDNINIAIIAALLFGVHTLHVESVAWVSERKDVLYSLFFVASLVSYVKFTKCGKYKYYVISFFMFVLSLFSKGQAVSLAVTLFAIDYFKNRKLLDIKIILEKVPFFILAVIFGLLAIEAQAKGNAIVSGEAYSFVHRIGFAGYAFMQYIIQLIAPVNLSAIYPYPDILNKTIPAYYWLFLLPSIAVLVFGIISFKKSKVVTFSIAFFIINIFLLLQFIPVGSAVHADRYAYIPSIGFFILIAWFAQRLIENKKEMKKVVFSFVGVFTIVLIFMTMSRNEVWANSEALWDDTVEKSPKAVVAWNNRGSLKDKKATVAKDSLNLKKAELLRRQAIKDFTIAIKGKPDYSHAFYNRGSSQYELGKQIADTLMIKKSIKDFTKALHFDPAFPEAYHNRGNAVGELGNLEEAMKDYDMAISLKKDDANFYVNRGVTKGKLNMMKEAVIDFNVAVKLNPRHESVYSNRGLARSRLGDKEGAIKDYDMAIRIKPLFFTAFFNRAITKYENEDFQGALNDINIVIQKSDKFIESSYWRGRIKEKLGDNKGALEDYNKIVEQRPTFFTVYTKRAIIKYKLGDIIEAINDLNFVIKNKKATAETFYWRGLCLMKLNKRNLAYKDFMVASKNKFKEADKMINKYFK